MSEMMHTIGFVASIWSLIGWVCLCAFLYYTTCYDNTERWYTQGWANGVLIVLAGPGTWVVATVVHAHEARFTSPRNWRKAGDRGQHA